MPTSTILSDNGVVSGTTGLKTAGGDDGTLILQTTTAGGTATTAMTINTSQAVTFAQTANLPNTFGFKNRIINGGMVIDQRNAGASGTGNDNYTVDRWTYFGSQASKGTWQQNAGSVTPPAGFSNYFGFTSSSAYSVGATEIFAFIQKIEGFNTSDLNFGKASAKTITISFWVYSSLTGTFGGWIANSAQNRNYPFSYTISSANTWEQKTVTISGDTTGTWIGSTNGIGMRVGFSLGIGSTNSTTANAWNGTSNAVGVTGATSVVGTNGATFYITGVQLEVGSTATSFDYRDYGRELAMCQRYYQSIASVWFYGVGNGGATTASVVNETQCPLFVALRASPTLGSVNTAQMDSDTYSTKTGITPTANAFNVNRQLVLNWTGLNADLQDNRPCAVRADSTLTISAEL
jgi:hypothetical protein